MMETVTLSLGFSPEEVAARKRSLGGSDATVLMSGDEPAIHDLWLRKTGRAEEPDLSAVLPVQIGVWTEELNARWYSRGSGRPVTSRGKLCRHARYEFMACHLDGITSTAAGEPAVFEAKHVNAFAKIEDVAQKYMAQLHHNMACAEVEWAVLSVFVGTLKHEVFEVSCDPFYLGTLIDREREFWGCVTEDRPPHGMAPVAPPVPPEKWRSVDMEALGHNEWADRAASWLQHRAAASVFRAVEKDIKALVESDVGHAFGYGISVKRSKAGALTIREAK